MRESLLVLTLIALGWCGSRAELPTAPPAPQPTPTPAPTPPPSTALSFPLGTNGTRFVDSGGRAIRMVGKVDCCGDAVRNGWPHISETSKVEFEDSGANFAHIRLGPYNNEFPEGRQFSFTHPSFWPRVEDIAAWSLSRGIALEVDVIDAWVLERGHNYSYFGWDCSITRAYPRQEQLRWVEQVAEHTRAYPNVMYQIGNETFDCGALSIWELAIAGHLRTHAPGHLIGTNSNSRDIINSRNIDYVSWHSPLYSPVQGKPTSINEYGPNTFLTADEWEANAKRAKAGGVYLHLWRGEMDPIQWRDSLAKIRGVIGF